MKRIARNLDFFKSILREKNRHRRLEKLLHANKDQINAVSEFTINMLKNNFPLPPHIVAKYESTNIISGKFQNTFTCVIGDYMT